VREKIKETDLFDPIKQYFESRGFEVYSEVLAGQGTRRADVVIRHGSVVSVIEMKTTLSLDLLEQANRWISRAHYVYIAIPMPKNRRINEYARKCLSRDGIGVLLVDCRQNDFYYDNGDEYMIWTDLKPKIHRKIVNHWDKYLTEAHKTSIPGGSKGGGYITPYKTTIDGVKRCLKNHPEGIELNQLILMVQTHYANPKNGLYQALTSFESDWCETYVEDRKRCFKIRKGAII